MPEPTTKPTEIPVDAFLGAVEPEQRREEGRALDSLFRRVTGFQPRMWGPTIVGYGRYSYRYASGHSGETLATGFSPRTAEIVLYIMPGYDGLGDDLARLGPHRTGKSCLYLRRLSTIDHDVLGLIIRKGLDDLATRWRIDPS